MCVHTYACDNTVSKGIHFEIKNQILFLKLANCPQVREILFWTTWWNLSNYPCHVTVCLTAMPSKYFAVQPFCFPFVLSDMPAVRWTEAGNAGVTVPATFPWSPHKWGTRIKQPSGRAAGGPRVSKSWRCEWTSVSSWYHTTVRW